MAMKRSPEIEAAMRAAGILVPSPRGKAKRAVKPLPASSWKFAPEILIVSFRVLRRPCPWKAPTVTRTGVTFKDKTLKEWQAAVSAAGQKAMAGLAPYAHAVSLELDFYLAPRKGSPPDVSNLGKSTEDALQGSVIVNDRKVVKVTSRRFLASGEDFAEIKVFSAEDQ